MMPYIKYVDRKFTPASLARIEQIVAILDDYEAQGYTLTLRGVYYQLVTKNLIANRTAEYKKLTELVKWGRRAGLLDWDMIDDGTRGRRMIPTWPDSGGILKYAAQIYRVDPWEDQPVYFEVWIEKSALAGIIAPVCNRLRVPYLACRGYVSESEVWRAGRRLAHRIDCGQRVVVLHLGDHDPSGLDMTRDNDERLDLFGEQAGIEVRRLALNYDQVEQYNPPPNPAKFTDSRVGGYLMRYGRECWELDALEPRVIGQLIRDAVEAEIEPAAWEDSMIHEESERDKLDELVRRWEYGDLVEDTDDD